MSGPTIGPDTFFIFCHFNMSRSLSPTIRDAVLLEAGYKCANPVCRYILPLELHHILWVKEGGGNEISNLVALCPNCHSLHTAGHIPKSAIETWKNLLTALNNPNRNTADLLLFLYNEEKSLSNESDPTVRHKPFEVSGDGLLLLAGLFVSHLIEKSSTHEYKPGDHRWVGAAGMPSYRVKLTEKGLRLVKAWLSGNAEAVSDAFTDENGIR